MLVDGPTKINDVRVASFTAFLKVQMGVRYATGTLMVRLRQSHWGIRRKIPSVTLDLAQRGMTCPQVLKLWVERFSDVPLCLILGLVSGWRQRAVIGQRKFHNRMPQPRCLGGYSDAPLVSQQASITGAIAPAPWRCSPQSAAPLHRIWNKPSELAFVVEGHRILGGGYAALAIPILNLRGRWLDRCARRGAKLPVVRGLQWRRHGRRRDELRVHDVSTMPRYCARHWWILRAEHPIPASIRVTSIQQDAKALSILNGRR
jgi:hypothetical protein